MRFFIAGIWRSFLTGFAGSVCILAGAWLYIAPTLPSVTVLNDMQLQTPLQIFTRDGLLIGEFGEKRRIPINYKDVPLLLIQAIIAAEDNRFQSHIGIDIWGLFRAFHEFLQSGRIQSGGSTITMQVARNYFLSREKTLARKLNEIYLALKIERSLSKSQILDLYVNKIYLGKRAYGVASAAQIYYGKPLSDLNLAQFAMLAGLPKAPSRYNPLTAPSRSLERRNWILRRMHDLKYIDGIAYDSAAAQPMTAGQHTTQLDLHAPHIAEMVRAELLSLFGTEVYTHGYRVFTTVESTIQKTAERAVLNGLQDYNRRHGYQGAEANVPPPDPGHTENEKKKHWLSQLANFHNINIWEVAVVTKINDDSFTAFLKNGTEAIVDKKSEWQKIRPYINENQVGTPYRHLSEFITIGDVIRLVADEKGLWQLSQLPKVQAALVALDNHNGAIRGLIGGFNFKENKFNRITQAERQTGSIFKPLLYGTALANNFTAASILTDAPIVFADDNIESTWRPRNDSGDFIGQLRLRQALYRSRNLASIRLLKELTVGKVSEYAKRFEIDTSKFPRDLSLALGSHAMSPMKITRSFTVFANGGYLVQPHLLLRIENLDGDVIYQPTVKNIPANAPTITTPDSESASLIANRTPISGDQPVTADNNNALKRIIDERESYIMHTILQDVIRKGTGRKARILKRRELAGKTGTTNGPTDAWFTGYNSSITATAWVGFDDNRPLGNAEYGGKTALPIWIEFMGTVFDGTPDIPRKFPDGMISVKTPSSRHIASESHISDFFEIYRKENSPQLSDMRLTRPSPTQAINVEDELIKELF